MESNQIVWQGTTPSGPVLTPPEVLIAIHGIDPDKDRIPLKKVASNFLFILYNLLIHRFFLVKI